MATTLVLDGAAATLGEGMRTIDAIAPVGGEEIAVLLGRL